ncbi:Stp1/IreP family PP2C-type Ser/Thr phosphatase [Heliobacterium gestii]|uniref:Stp1/IreP family PP2C-type Ser/Thr phosphatase n=1 Tax=Heliomicrobium gestii TaxID=2699 RepID=A0A845LA97_HELGE|nr:Stp1/IreP family PP2C-type Ser/Thr phosphatase [Heliomicrobium gestii]MBM7867013.1 protein phosphatase [Heliomicrobium gestii]MZP43572.1 Stp1/IreP family PP2C-type Ser/Thr phosphatase [Heliomicrobium gestii]
MNVIARTDKGRVRPTNEDSHWWDAAQGLFLVADGMGGHEAGEVASALAVQAFAAQWRGTEGDREPAIRLESACREANRRIYWESVNQPKWAGMGTTLTAAHLAASTLTVAHVGDSRAYLLHNGQVRLLTRDHSLVEEMVRLGKITEAEAQAHPQRNIITRALGTRDDVQVDVAAVPWTPRDLLILCTDGLTNMVTADEINRLFDPNAPFPYRREALEQVADAMMNLALERGGYDNVTFLIIWQEEGEGWQA